MNCFRYESICQSIRFLNFTKVDVNTCIDYFLILYSHLVQPLLWHENRMACCVFNHQSLRKQSGCRKVTKYSVLVIFDTNLVCVWWRNTKINVCLDTLSSLLLLRLPRKVTCRIESTWVRILMSTSVYYFRIFFLKATNSYLIFTAYASMKKCSYSKYTVQRGPIS